MTVPDLDTILGYARVTYPPDKPWKKRVAEIVCEDLANVRVFMELGLEAIRDPVRKQTVLSHIGPLNGHDGREYGFNVWLLDQCAGDRALDDGTIFWLCMACHKLRTNRQVLKSMTCRYCGSQRAVRYFGPTETKRNLWTLAAGA